jgi:hypothetical protein
MQGNMERCRHVAKAIRENPDHFDMDYWFGYKDDDGTLLPQMIDGGQTLERLVNPAIFEECGTAACAAGWAIHEYPDEVNFTYEAFQVSTNAAVILGMNHGEANSLFNKTQFSGEEVAWILDHWDTLDEVPFDKEDLDEYMS